MKCSTCGYESVQLVTCPKCHTNNFDLFEQKDASCDLIHSPVKGIISGVFIGLVTHSLLMVLVTQGTLIYKYLFSDTTYSFIGMPYEARRALFYGPTFAIVYVIASLIAFIFVRSFVRNTELIPCSVRVTYIMYFSILILMIGFILM